MMHPLAGLPFYNRVYYKWNPKLKLDYTTATGKERVNPYSRQHTNSISYSYVRHVIISPLVPAPSTKSKHDLNANYSLNLNAFCSVRGVVVIMMDTLREMNTSFAYHLFELSFIIPHVFLLLLWFRQLSRNNTAVSNCMRNRQPTTDQMPSLFFCVWIERLLLEHKT